MVSRVSRQRPSATVEITGPVAETNLLEAWMPETELPIGHFSAAAKFQAANGGLIDCGDVNGISCVFCQSAMPHVDPVLPEWGVLWILRSAPDHELWLADHTPMGRNSTTRRPLKSPHWKVPLTVGSLVLFNLHRTHWVPKPALEETLVAATFEFDGNRPSRYTVEQKLAQLIRVSS
jgi:hypothetical protein